MTDKEKEEIRQIVRQEFENLVKKNNKETGAFYNQMQKYWAMIKRMQELGLDYTIPFRIVIPSRYAFYRAFGGKPRVEINDDINDLEGLSYDDIF